MLGSVSNHGARPLSGIQSRSRVTFFDEAEKGSDVAGGADRFKRKACFQISNSFVFGLSAIWKGEYE